MCAVCFCGAQVVPVMGVFARAWYVSKRGAAASAGIDAADEVDDDAVTVGAPADLSDLSDFSEHRDFGDLDELEVLLDGVALSRRP